MVLARGGTLALSPLSPKVPRNVSIAFPQFPIISELSRVLSSQVKTVMVIIQQRAARRPLKQAPNYFVLTLLSNASAQSLSRPKHAPPSSHLSQATNDVKSSGTAICRVAVSRKVAPPHPRIVSRSSLSLPPFHYLSVMLCASS